VLCAYPSARKKGKALEGGDGVEKQNK